MTFRDYIHHTLQIYKYNRWQLFSNDNCRTIINERLQNESGADGPRLKLWMYGTIRDHIHPEFIRDPDIGTLFMLN